MSPIILLTSLWLNRQWIPLAGWKMALWTLRSIWAVACLDPAARVSWEPTLLWMFSSIPAPKGEGGHVVTSQSAWRLWVQSCVCQQRLNKWLCRFRLGNDLLVTALQESGVVRDPKLNMTAINWAVTPGSGTSAGAQCPVSWALFEEDLHASLHLSKSWPCCACGASWQGDGGWAQAVC